MNYHMKLSINVEESRLQMWLKFHVVNGLILSNVEVKEILKIMLKICEVSLYWTQYLKRKLWKKEKEIWGVVIEPTTSRQWSSVKKMKEKRCEVWDSNPQPPKQI